MVNLPGTTSSAAWMVAAQLLYLLPLQLSAAKLRKIFQLCKKNDEKVQNIIVLVHFRLSWTHKKKRLTLNIVGMTGKLDRCVP